MQFNEKPLNSYSRYGVFDNLLEIGDVTTKKGSLRSERMSPSEDFLRNKIKRQTCGTDFIIIYKSTQWHEHLNLLFGRQNPFLRWLWL